MLSQKEALFVEINRERILGFVVFDLLVVLLGCFLLVWVFPVLDLDMVWEYLLLIFIGMMFQWLILSFPSGNVSGEFALVLFSTLIYGYQASAVIVGLAILISKGIANRNSPLYFTLFNLAQQVIAILGAGVVSERFSQTTIGFLDMVFGRNELISNAQVLFFILIYFVITQALSICYSFFLQEYPKNIPWQNILRWKVITSFITIPFGIVIALLYLQIGIEATLMLIPLLAIQFILRMYIKVELNNRQLKVMYRISKYLGIGSKMDKIPLIFLKNLKGAIPFHCGLIYLATDVPKFFKVKASYGSLSESFKGNWVWEGKDFLGEVIFNEEAEIIEDSKFDFRVRNEKGFFKVCRSIMILPLKADEQVLGLLVLGDKDPKVYTESHFELLSSMIGVLNISLLPGILKNRIAYLETRYSLTGLLNRQTLLGKAYEIFEEEEIVGAILIGIDNMSLYNARYSYSKGDKLIKEVAKLASNFKIKDGLVGHYEGDKILFLLPKITSKEALEFANYFCRLVSNHHFEGIRGSVHVSCGVSLRPENAKSINQLLQVAEKSLAKAKKSGKNRVVQGFQL